MAARATHGLLAVLCALAVGSCRPASPGGDAPEVEGRFPIVLVLIDALRADRVNLAPGREPVAPSLAALAEDSVVFRNAFASAPKTIPSVPQLFTSQRFPDIHHDVTLMSVCRDAGYEGTAAFIHNPYVSKWLGRLEPTFDRLGGGDFDARRLTDDAIAWLDQRRSDRIALYVHYLDVHTPLKPPPDIAARFVDPLYQGPIGLEFADTSGAWSGRYDDADKRRIAQLYDASVAATDEQLGRLVKALKDDGLYDEALIVVTSDHGEEMWEHGSYFHGHTLYDELLRVPLVVKFPGGWKAGTSVDRLARVLDVLPTITDMLARDVASPFAAPATDGESLLPLVLGQGDPRVLFATVGRVDDRSPPLHAVRTETAKLIVDVRDGAEQLFDLVRDPAELDNLAGKAAAAPMLENLRRELDAGLLVLSGTGTHLRVTNGTGAPVRYTADIGNIFGAPLVNLARFEMEPGDTLSQGPRADSVRMTGVLAPGDTDELRFDMLSTDAAILARIAPEPVDVPVELCAGTEPACAPVAGGKAKIELERLQADSRPAPRPTSGLQMQWWSVAGSSEPIAPVLSPEDRERLRALGYAE